MDSIRVFIGSEPKTEIARLVLEHSILQHTKRQVEFTAMIGPEWEYDISGIPVGTGFSLRRWLIPAHCKWQGRAIYVDADILALADIAGLWEMPDNDGAPRSSVSAWMTWQADKFSRDPWPQSSVMVIDCGHAKKQWGWHKDKMLSHLKAHSTKKEYAEFMHATWMAPCCATVSKHWNGLNICTPGKTKLLHFTKEDEQPWTNVRHPLASLWRTALADAIKAGRVPESLFSEAISKYGVQEDWRKTNGLSPTYADLKPLFSTR